MGILFVSIFASSAFAQPQDDTAFEEKAKRAEKRMEKLAEELNLTPEQQAAIKQNRSENFDQAGNLHKRLREVRKQLKDELDKADTDIAKVKGLTAQLKELEAQMIDSRVSRIVEMKKILTPEQYKQLQQKMQERIKERREKRFKGHKDN